MRPDLAERVGVLRDEVLDTAGLHDREPAGAEVFEAVLRLLESGSHNTLKDGALHDAISRRLAWGQPEQAVLADIDAVCKRMLSAAQRAFREPVDQIAVTKATADVGAAAARVVAMAALGRAGRERAAQLREDLAQNRLKQALDRQREELVRLKKALSDT